MKLTHRNRRRKNSFSKKNVRGVVKFLKQYIHKRFIAQMTAAITQTLKSRENNGQKNTSPEELFVKSAELNFIQSVEIRTLFFVARAALTVMKERSNITQNATKII